MTITDPAVTARSLTPAAVHNAYTLIKPYIHTTPLLTCKTLDAIASTPQSAESLRGTSFEGQAPAKPKFRFFFKCENFQRIGAFKARGAFHALLRLIEQKGKDEVRKRGVITHSSGLSSYTLQYSMPPLNHDCGGGNNTGEVIPSRNTDNEKETMLRPSLSQPPPSISPHTSSCLAYPHPQR